MTLEPGPPGVAVLAAAGRSRSRYLDRLADLVGMDSGSADAEGVARVAGRVAEFARESGMHAEAVPVPDGRAVLIARRSGGGKSRIMLAAHLDTVFAEGTAAERPFRLDADGARAYGPGVCDDKGGLLAGIAAVETLARLGTERYGELMLVCTPDEEIGSPAGRAVLESTARGVDVALCLECARDNGDLVRARKGVADVEIELTGRAAHAGIEPEKGANAALAAARLTLACQRLNGRWPGVTVNVGVLAAGEVPNAVAGSGRLVVDVRAGRPEPFGEAVAEVRRLSGAHGVAGVTAEVALPAPMPPWSGGEATGRLVELAQRSAAGLGFKVEAAATGGAADANLIAATGTPVLDGLGPVGGADHTPGEWLDVGSIVPRTALLAMLIDRI